MLAFEAPSVNQPEHTAGRQSLWIALLVTGMRYMTNILTHSTDTKYHIMDRNQLYPLKKVKSIVDLGVHFESNLTFRDNISEKN